MQGRQVSGEGQGGLGEGQGILGGRILSGASCSDPGFRPALFPGAGSVGSALRSWRGVLRGWGRGRDAGSAARKEGVGDGGQGWDWDTGQGGGLRRHVPGPKPRCRGGCVPNWGGGLDPGGVATGWGLARRAAGAEAGREWGRCGNTWSPPPPPTPQRARPAPPRPTLCSSMAAAQVTPARPAGPAHAESPSCLCRGR